MRHPLHLLADYFSATTPTRLNLPSRVNIAPGLSCLMINQHENGNDRRLIQKYWGYQPPWAGDDFDLSPIINARIEGILDKSFYSHAITHNRCIIPATGFYEWTTTNTTNAETNKQPHAIARTPITDPARLEHANIAPLAMAGVWAKNDHLPGDHKSGFAILTRPAPESIRNLHDRAPVILSKNQIGPWLMADYPKGLLDDLRRRNDINLIHWPVSTALNNPENDDISLLDETSPAKPAQGQLF